MANFVVPRCALVLCLSLFAFRPCSAKPDVGENQQLAAARSIRVAVLNFEVAPGLDVTSAALTDHVTTLLSEIDQVTVVNRDQLQAVAEEHKIAFSGLVDPTSAVKLGRFVSAQYIINGRASHVGQTGNLVVKVIDVETTVQSLVAVKAPVEKGFAHLLERLEEPFVKEVRRLQEPATDGDDEELDLLRKLAKPLAGKVFLVAVDEQHLSRPLRDPAAQMAVVKRLRQLGIAAFSPTDPSEEWRKSLLETGRYADQKIDFLLEGEGVSGYAAQVQGLISCRARVELRIVAVPGRLVIASDRGVGSGVDLIEALAAKTALENAAIPAIDAAVPTLVAHLATAAEKPREK